MDDSGKHFSKGNEMKTIRKRLEEARKETGLPWEIIEKDYILSWILAGIATNKSLKNELIFKGGTALKKCYFEKQSSPAGTSRRRYHWYHAS